MPRLVYETTTLCPHCDELLPGKVLAGEEGVYITRTCAEHGELRGLVCSDLAWWNSLPRFDVAPVKPTHSRTVRVHGCPDDCGLCTAHRQSAGTAAIEISNRCNAACPVCLADNLATFEMSVDQVRAIVDRAVDEQGTLDILTLSGGEPTIHPDFFDILEVALRPEIGRLVVNTNGIRIAGDDAFLDRLTKVRGVYVSLHHDGPHASALRGTDFALQQRALDRLCERGIPVVPLVLAARGVNDMDLGPLMHSLLTKSSAVKSIIVSLMAHAGHGGRSYPMDPMRRLTIPGALDCMESSSSGALCKRDFMPLPMPNPMCAAIGYYLVDEDGLLGLLPVAGEERVVEATKNAHFARPDDKLETFFRETIERVFAHASGVDDADRVLARLKRFVGRLFPRDGKLSSEERAGLAEDSIKTVYLMQFMDGWTFDTKRLEKCSCQHLMDDGVRMPSCGYYAYHRKKDPRFAPRQEPGISG